MHRKELEFIIGELFDKKKINDFEPDNIVLSSDNELFIFSDYYGTLLNIESFIYNQDKIPNQRNFSNFLPHVNGKLNENLNEPNYYIHNSRIGSNGRIKKLLGYSDLDIVLRNNPFFEGKLDYAYNNLFEKNLLEKLDPKNIVLMDDKIFPFSDYYGALFNAEMIMKNESYFQDKSNFEAYKKELAGFLIKSKNLSGYPTINGKKLDRRVNSLLSKLRFSEMSYTFIGDFVSFNETEVDSVLEDGEKRVMIKIPPEIQEKLSQFENNNKNSDQVVYGNINSEDLKSVGLEEQVSQQNIQRDVVVPVPKKKRRLLPILALTGLLSLATVTGYFLKTNSEFRCDVGIGCSIDDKLNLAWKKGDYDKYIKIVDDNKSELRNSFYLKSKARFKKSIDHLFTLDDINNRYEFIDKITSRPESKSKLSLNFMQGVDQPYYEMLDDRKDFVKEVGFLKYENSLIKVDDRSKYRNLVEDYVIGIYKRLKDKNILDKSEKEFLRATKKRDIIYIGEKEHDNNLKSVHYYAVPQQSYGYKDYKIDFIFRGDKLVNIQTEEYRK